MSTRVFRSGLVIMLILFAFLSVGADTGLILTNTPALPHIDWVGHFFLAGVIAFFADGALEFRAFVPLLRRGPAIVLAILAMEEISQRFFRRRSSSWEDFAADVAGVIALSWIAKVVAARRAPSGP